VSEIMKFWPVILVALNGFTAWLAWSMRQVAKNQVEAAEGRSQARDRALDEKIDAHDTQLTKLEGRMEEVEDDISNLPTKADLARVEGEVKASGASAAAAAAGVRRLEDFFIERGVKV